MQNDRDHVEDEVNRVQSWNIADKLRLIENLVAMVRQEENV